MAEFQWIAAKSGPPSGEFLKISLNSSDPRDFFEDLSTLVSDLSLLPYCLIEAERELALVEDTSAFSLKNLKENFGPRTLLRYLLLVEDRSQAQLDLNIKNTAKIHVWEKVYCSTVESLIKHERVQTHFKTRGLEPKLKKLSSCSKSYLKNLRAQLVELQEAKKLNETKIRKQWNDVILQAMKCNRDEM